MQGGGPPESLRTPARGDPRGRRRGVRTPRAGKACELRSPRGHGGPGRMGFAEEEQRGASLHLVALDVRRPEMARSGPRSAGVEAKC